jgi:enoyl-[acyl-carrier protein] reductase II
MIIKANDTSTKVTGRSTGHPVRQIRNQLTKKYLELEAQGAGLEELEQFTVGSLRRAVVDGNTKEGTFMAGQIAGMITEQRTASKIIEDMFSQADELLGRKLEV